MENAVIRFVLFFISFGQNVENASPRSRFPHFVHGAVRFPQRRLKNVWRRYRVVIGSLHPDVHARWQCRLRTLDKREFCLYNSIVVLAITVGG